MTLRCEATGVAAGTSMAETPGCTNRLGALPFRAYYTYSPSGCDPTSRRSRRVCAAIKEGDRRWIAGCIADLRARCGDGPESPWSLGEPVLLVPVPACAPRSAAVVDVSGRIAAALVHAGFGAEVWPALERRYAVRKSATAPAGSRPTVQEHFASFGLADIGMEYTDASFVLVDDVITRGRTMLAAACRLHAAYPRARISAFALMRTMGYAPALARLVDPCLGEIRWRRGDASRIP